MLEPLAFLWVSVVIELTLSTNMTYLAVLSLVDGRISDGGGTQSALQPRPMNGIVVAITVMN